MAVTVFATVTTFKIMSVLVMLIMLMFVLMLQGFMQVLMGMVLSQVQPHAQGH